MVVTGPSGFLTGRRRRSWFAAPLLLVALVLRSRRLRSIVSAICIQATPWLPRYVLLFSGVIVSAGCGSVVVFLTDVLPVSLSGSGIRVRGGV
jgi:hypothetical protein